MEWINIKDGFPEENMEVLVWGEHFFDIPVQAFFYNKQWKGSREVTEQMNNGYVEDRVFSNGHRITHWMPLPKTPKLNR